jgi:hypothetical protein
MSHTIPFQRSRDSQAYSSKPLDETVWRAWMKENLLEEKRRAAARNKGVNWACIGVLAVAAMASPYVSASLVPAYEVVVRLTIGGGALAMMFDNLYAREYVLAALFAAIALLLNPVLPAFALSANGLILLASMFPLVASLVWMKRRIQPAAAPSPS